MKKLNKLIKIILLSLNTIAIFLLLLSYLAKYINPEKTTFFAFMGLGYPIFLFLNSLFILIWSLLRKWYFLGSLTAILLGYNIFPKYIQLFPKKRYIPENSFKVMTYNVRNFDVYNFITNQMGFENRDKILKIIQNEKPDIICFQEFFYDSSHVFKTYDTLLTLLPPMNLHINYTSINKKIAHFGQAIFSRFPIVNKGRIYFSTSKDNACIYADILINNDTVRIYNLHLASVGFGKEDYGIKNIFSEITQINENEMLKKNISNIYYRIHDAFKRRVKEAKSIVENIKSCHYPIILCGDFNDTPISFSYQEIINSRNLKDAFSDSGWGFAQTYAGPFPTLHIDHILFSNDFESYNYQIIKENCSDHYPIVTYFVRK